MAKASGSAKIARGAATAATRTRPTEAEQSQLLLEKVAAVRALIFRSPPLSPHSKRVERERSIRDLGKCLTDSGELKSAYRRALDGLAIDGEGHELPDVLEGLAKISRDSDQQGRFLEGALRARVVGVRDWIERGAPKIDQGCLSELRKTRLVGEGAKERYAKALENLAQNAEDRSPSVDYQAGLARNEIMESLAEISRDPAQRSQLLERALRLAGSGRSSRFIVERRIFEKILTTGKKGDPNVALRTLARLATCHWERPERALFQNNAVAVLDRSSWTSETSEGFSAVVTRATVSRLSNRCEIAYAANKPVRQFIKSAQGKDSTVPRADLLKAMTTRVRFANEAVDPNDPAPYGAVVNYSVEAGDEAMRQGQYASAVNFYTSALAKADPDSGQYLEPHEETYVHHALSLAHRQALGAAISEGDSSSILKHAKKLAQFPVDAIRNRYENDNAYDKADQGLREDFSLAPVDDFARAR